MRIGILQAGDLPDQVKKHHGDYPDLYIDMLSGNGFEYTVCRVLDGQYPDSVNAADGWLISGSSHGAYEPLPWIPGLENFIRAAHAASVPMVGICFGHQIMAQAFGGRVEKFAGGWGLGRMEYLDSQRERLRLNAFHQDQVIAPPTGSRTFLSSDFCRFAGLDYGNFSVSVQPHPEFDDPFLEELLRFRRGTTLSESNADAALDSLKGKSDSPLIAGMLSGFLAREPAEPSVPVSADSD